MDAEQQAVVVPLVARQPASRFLFTPFEYRHRLWNIVMAIVACYILWTIPYIIGFVHEMKGMWTIQEYVMCFIISLDCFISFNTIYVDDMRNTFISNRSHIARRYLRGWGVIDVMSAIPTHLVSLPFSGPNNILIRKLLISIRLVHIRRIFNSSNRTRADKSIWNSFLSWIHLVFITSFLIHFMACVFYLVAKLNPKVERTWLSLIESERANENHRRLFDYISSIYWSTTAFTTVGYEDVHPVNKYEMIVNIIFMMLGMSLFTYIGADFIERLSRNIGNKNQNEALEALKEYNRSNHLSVELREEMFNHLIQQSQIDQVPEQKIIGYFPRNIQNKLKKYRFSQLISQLYLFQGVSGVFISHLVAEMELKSMGANVKVLTSDDIPENIWVLVVGGMVRDSVESALPVCGEFSVITGLLEPFTVRTTKNSSFLSIARRKFMRLVELSKDDGARILSNMLSHILSQQEDLVLQSFHERTLKKLERCEMEMSLTLEFAIQMNNSNLLFHLIKRGANVHQKYQNGQTILHIVADHEQELEPRLVDILLQHSMDVDKRDFMNQPPISYAIRRRRKAILEVFRARRVTIPEDVVVEYFNQVISNIDVELLGIVYDLGGDINVGIDDDGNTLVHNAVWLGNIELMRFLLNVKADVEKRNISLKSALEIARINCSEAICRLLIKYGVWSSKRVRI